MRRICIVTALPAESRVFIDALKLRPILDHGWRLYGNSEYLLLQTGLGKLKAAAAVSVLLHTQQDISAIVNVGIAGGGASIGDTFLAHQVTDHGSGENWYPHLPPRKIVGSVRSSVIETRDTASSVYQADTLFDMEAAGIMSAASRYLSTDAIQFIKVVSDNSKSSLGAFKPSMVTDLMQPTVTVVTDIATWFATGECAHAQTSKTLELRDKITNAVRHTATEKHQLLRLLHQHCALAGELPEASQLLQTPTASQLIRKLTAINADIPLFYGATS